MDSAFKMLTGLTFKQTYAASSRIPTNFKRNFANEVKKKILVIAGPTAIGKTELSVRLAKKLNGAIISCDSIQTYRGFPIGSAKVKEIEKLEIPHYLLDVVNAQESIFTAGHFFKKTREYFQVLANF